MGFRVIYVDSTAGTAVNPATGASPQVIKTTNLNVTDDEWIAVTATFRVTAATSTHAQTIHLQVVIGANTYDLPFTYIATQDAYVTAVFPAVSRAGDTVTAQLAGSAGSADPLCSVNVYAFYVQAWSGIQGGT